MEGREGEEESNGEKKCKEKRIMMRRCWNYGSRTDSDTSLRRTLSCIEQSPRITERRGNTRRLSKWSEMKEEKIEREEGNQTERDTY